MDAERLVLQIELMLSEARKRLTDASILSSNLESTSDAAYLLQLLAFELLLKATVRIHTGSVPRNHGYPELFASLPQEIRTRVVTVAASRLATQGDLSDLDGLLGTWGQNFVQLRYPFERYEGMTEDEYIAHGERWFERGALDAEADFTYYPEELAAVTHALAFEVRTWLGTDISEDI